MARQPGLFDVDEQLRRLSDIGDQLDTSTNRLQAGVISIG